MITNRFTLTGQLLIVDDEANSFRAVQSLLKPYDVKIHHEFSYLQLSQRIYTTRHDIVLLRISGLRNGEARVDGLTLLRQLLHVNPHSVIIMLATEQEGELAIRAIELGATDFILLPIHGEKLLATLNAAIALKISRAQLESLRRSVSQPEHSVPFKPVEPTRALPLETFNLDHIEREVIVRALRHYKGNIKRSAKELGVTRTTLYRRLEKYGL